MSKLTWKKTAALVMTVTMLTTAAAGCGNNASSSASSEESSTSSTVESSESSSEESSAASATEEETDEMAAKNVADLIDAIYVQERNDNTDEECKAAKEAWDALTDAQKELVEGDNADRIISAAIRVTPRKTTRATKTKSAKTSCSLSASVRPSTTVA